MGIADTTPIAEDDMLELLNFARGTCQETQIHPYEYLDDPLQAFERVIEEGDAMDGSSAGALF